MNRTAMALIYLWITSRCAWREFRYYTIECSRHDATLLETADSRLGQNEIQWSFLEKEIRYEMTSSRSSHMPLIRNIRINRMQTDHPDICRHLLNKSTDVLFSHRQGALSLRIGIELNISSIKAVYSNNSFEVNSSARKDELLCQ